MLHPNRMTVDPAQWRRLEEVCQAALERPVEERPAFLREFCGDDEALRRDAESLLERDAHAGGFLSTPLAALAADAVTYSPGGTPQVETSGNLVGLRLGHFELGAKIGAGGMGVVYRAHDHSLGRSVAIKVLPASFAADRDRLARFEREARLLASLNHPNIAAIHGLERSGDLTALVLELIDGETLETRLSRGPMAVVQALDVGVQMASALDHAHRHGITHRDLKPANVMLTKHGVKLLDFGLAKWSQRTAGYAPGSGEVPALRPQGAPTLTQEGTILGTVHYMAPEQLEGKAVDARADVFAFGAVLFEMLTARKAFDGGSAAAVMAAVLSSEPPRLETTQPLAPRSLDRAVRKCLAKDPDDRWQSARDLADELRWIATESTRTTPTTGANGPATGAASTADGRWKWARASAGAAAVVALAWFGGSAWPRPAAAPTLITRFAVQPTTAMEADSFDVSPDGRAIAFAASARVGQEPMLFVRLFDQFQDVPIAGTELASYPFYSPDGQSVGLNIGNRLMKVNLRNGTTPVMVCECVDRLFPGGRTWLEDGRIIFTRQDRSLMQVEAEGGEPSELTPLIVGKELDHHNPAPLPGGRALLFTSHGVGGTFDVEVLRLDTGARKVVVKTAYDARYLAGGHLVFARAGSLFAVPFDLDQLETTGPVVSLVDRLRDVPDSGIGNYRVSANGTLVYRERPSLEGRTLTWVTRDGVEAPVPIPPRAFGSPRVSPDGTRLAFAVEDGGRRDIWIYELATQKLVRVTREGDNKTPVWSHDSRRLAYASSLDGTPRILVRPADSNGLPEVVQTGADKAGQDVMVPVSWSSDDRALVYTHADTSARGSRTEVVDVRGERRSQALFPDETRGAAVSPDGRWVAFTSVDSRWAEVNVAAFPTPTTRHQISVGGGRTPRWRPDGRELVYRTGARMFSASIDYSGGFRSSAPVLLFERPYVVGGRDVAGLDYDLAPDGRFLMIKPSPDELRTNSVNVVMNWVEELKQRVQPGR